MDYFLNYGGVLIMYTLIYIGLFWGFPLWISSQKWSEYFFTVLALHLLVGLVLWAEHGFAWAEKIKN